MTPSLAQHELEPAIQVQADAARRRQRHRFYTWHDRSSGCKEVSGSRCGRRHKAKLRHHLNVVQRYLALPQMRFGRHTQPHFFAIWQKKSIVNYPFNEIAAQGVGRMPFASAELHIILDETAVFLWYDAISDHAIAL